MNTVIKSKLFKSIMRNSFMLLALLVVGLGYQNCTQQKTAMSEVSNQSSFSNLSLSSEDDLFNMLQESRELSALLKTYDLSKDTASDVLAQAPTVSKDLADRADLIEKAITVDLIPSNSNSVLKEVDSLVNLLSKARDIRVAYDSIRRDKLLALRIDQVEDNLNQAVQKLSDLGGAFDTFKDAISSRVDGLVLQMDKWQERVDTISKAISDLAAKGAAEDLVLKQALEQLKKYTETELTEVKEKSQTLEADLKKQAEDAARTAADINKAKEEMDKLGDISKRLCNYNSTGQISDARTKCTTAGEANCCLTVDVVDCAALFPPASASAALNQCSILMTVIKNHDQQLQAIQAVDEKQNTALNKINSSIDSIIGDVTKLNNNVKDLATGLDKVKAVTDELANQISSVKDKIQKNDDATKSRLASLDTQLLLLEFKANRTEVINGLQARANATLAWAILRYAHVNEEFCNARRQQAYAMFDYKVTRQNFEYCKEKRSLAVLAQSMANVANAYAGLLGSVNVDNDCSASINGKAASSLTNAELMNDATMKELVAKCTTGGKVVARGMILNAVRYLKQIGPDFRTYQAMGAVSKGVNIAFFGKEWAEVAEADQKEFDEIDPTSELYKDTPYGQVERLFIYNYYANAFRDGEGKFISDARNVNANVKSSIFSEKELIAGLQVGKNLPDYVKRVRNLEVENFCSDCGFAVTGRNNPDSPTSSLSISHGEGKKRFFFPNQPKSDLCPVDDDVVIRHADGKHYVYHLSFDKWGNDLLVPSFTKGLATKIANSDSDLANGNFNSCGYHKDVKLERSGLDMASIPTRLTLRATRPYGKSYGRPSCTKLTAVCAVQNNEWQAPASLKMSASDLTRPETQGTLTRYLTGFPEEVIATMCSAQQPAAGAPTPTYVNNRNIASVQSNRGLRFAWSNPAAGNASLKAQGYIAEKSTQLVGNAYWPFQNGPLPYTSEKIMLGPEKAFAIPLGANSSPSNVLSSTNYIREVDEISEINVQECSHCPANLKMLGGCGDVLKPNSSSEAGH